VVLQPGDSLVAPTFELSRHENLSPAGWNSELAGASI
jgi:hypothetical protein